MPSFLQKLRDKSAVLIFVLIVISLVAFVLQDAFVGGPSHLFDDEADRGAIAVIDGKAVPRQKFEDIVQMATQTYQKQGEGPLPEQFRYALIENAWKQFIDANLIQADAENLGLRVTQMDMNHLFLGENVPLYIREQLTNGQPEKYDRDQIRDYLAQMQRRADQDAQKLEFTSRVVGPLLDRLLAEKYLYFVLQGLREPKWLHKKDSVDAAAAVSADYVFVPYTKMPSPEQKAEHQRRAVDSYYTKHTGEFESKQAVRYVDLVYFSTAPTSTDTASVLKQFATYRAGLLSATDPKAFVTRNGSNIPFTGGYLKPPELLRFSQATRLLSLSRGEVLGPFVEQGNYVLAKLLKKVNLPDSVKCRHILIATKNPSSGEEIRTDSAARVLADSMAFYLKKGKTFAELARQYSDDKGSYDNGGEYTFSYRMFSQLAPEFAQAVFFSPPGTKKVISTQFGVHYVEVQQHKRPSPAFQFAFLSKKIAASRQTVDSVLQKANAFLSTVGSPAELVQKAKDNTYSILQDLPLSADDYAVPAIGVVRSIVKWAYGAKPGDISEVYPVGDYLMIAALNRETPKGAVDTKKYDALVLARIQNERKAHEIRQQTQSQTDLRAIAQQYKTDVKRIHSSSWNGLIEGVGVEPTLQGALLSRNAKGVLTVPGKFGVYFVKVDRRFPVATVDASDNQRTRISAAERVQSLAEALRVNHKLEEKKNNFY